MSTKMCKTMQYDAMSCTVRQNIVQSCNAAEEEPRAEGSRGEVGGCRGAAEGRGAENVISHILIKQSSKQHYMR